MNELPECVLQLLEPRREHFVLAKHSYPDNPTDITASIFSSDICDDENICPFWSFDRYGMSVTHLEDGRIILIGGEHEDYYDPYFFIYNDVWAACRAPC